MAGRSAGIIGIFLLCLLAVSCGGPGGADTADLISENKAGAETMEVLKEIIYKTDNVGPGVNSKIAAEMSGTGSDERSAADIYPAGTLTETYEPEVTGADAFFYYTEITPDIQRRMDGKSYGADCTIPYEDLRYVRILHMGFDHEIHIGELIVNKAIAEDTVDIFKELYLKGYPIELMVLIDEYDADDILSMEADNSSAFNFRYVYGTTRLSSHSSGMAIDINPLYNPYITEKDGNTVILPENGEEYADRTKDCPYYIKEGDPCYEAFTSRGFTWGGKWQGKKDYQHFQKD